MSLPIVISDVESDDEDVELDDDSKVELREGEFATYGEFYACLEERIEGCNRIECHSPHRYSPQGRALIILHWQGIEVLHRLNANLWQDMEDMPWHPYMIQRALAFRRAAHYIHSEFIGDLSMFCYHVVACENTTRDDDNVNAKYKVSSLLNMEDQWDPPYTEVVNSPLPEWMEEVYRMKVTISKKRK